MVRNYYVWCELVFVDICVYVNYKEEWDDNFYCTGFGLTR